MDTKKILIIVILLFAAAGGYVLFAKSKKSDVVVDGQAGKDNGDGTITLTKNNGETITVTKPESEEVQAALLQNLKDTLSDVDKQNASVLASQIFEDMKGWNLHNMLIYKTLLESSKPYFLYFVENAYPSFDKNKSFSARLKLQNFRSVNRASKRAKLDDDNAEALIAKIVNRMIEFKI